jgi:hypothetical protein
VTRSSGCPAYGNAPHPKEAASTPGPLSLSIGFQIGEAFLSNDRSIMKGERGKARIDTSNVARAEEVNA